MLYEIIELGGLSGSECTIYSLVPKGSEVSLFREFVDQHLTDFPEEIENIEQRLKLMGDVTGVRANFFKEFEGKPGDGVCALYDLPGKHLRLYCIRYGMMAIILGGGGPKGKEVIRWQDDAVLTKEVSRVMAYAEHIGRRLEAREDLRWSGDYKHLEGELRNYGKEAME